MSAARQRRLTPVLIGCVVALVAAWLGLLAGLGSGVHWDAPRASSSPPTNAARPAAASASSMAPSFAAVWQQSLFSPDRKPEARGASVGADNGLALTGVILTPSLRMALLRDGSAQREWRLREGQSSPDGSVTVVEVKPRGAVLDTAQGRIELPLSVGAAPMAEPNETAAAPNLDGKAATPPPAVQAETAPVQMAARYNPQQLDTLRKLKAAVQQRRAASQAANEGVH